MNDLNLIMVDIRQGDIEHSLPLGEFLEQLGNEAKEIAFTSRLLSRKGTVDKEELKREVKAAGDRVIQRIRDSRRIAQ